jgi:hypothetical protein
MTKKVFALDTKPGVQRDGTIFDKQFYSDGRWVRFQRGRPRKVGGYREIVSDLSGISRGIYVNPQNNFNYVFSGFRGGIQVLPIDNNGVGSGITNLTLSDFTANDSNLYQFDVFTDVQGGSTAMLLAHPGQNLSDINSSVNTPVLGGSVSGTTMSAIGTFPQSIVSTGTAVVTIATANILIGAGQLVTGTGIPANTTVVSVVGTSVTLSNVVPAGTIAATFDNQIDVSGGVVVLHPYVFVYGNNGLLRNCSAGNLSDWVSADANAQNVATGKIVQGLPVRGGSNSPSGLFWSLDSLIRVSYNPTTINVGGTAITQFWRYDTISSQSSILSSQCAIEYDGIYYWIGVDRFMLYNGVVKEIPNTMNQNYFFDNLNYAQRQKVWATKVPRFGEVWWFYPRGDSVECNDAIVYNIRENCWYDAGEAVGARRSAGYFSQVFRFPIGAGWESNATGGVLTTTLTNAGSGYTNGTYAFLPVTGGSGSGATATVVVSGGVVTSFTIQDEGVGYAVGNTIAVSNATLGGGTGLVVTVASTDTFVSLWQHEIGTDAVRGTTDLAIESYFETNDLGWVSGGPSQPSAVGDNKWLHIERVEPDFVQSGTMECYVTGRPFAQSEDKTSEAFLFEPGTNKIDMREQRRELRLRFVSNVSGGDYQTGRIIVNADTGDVRGY